MVLALHGMLEATTIIHVNFIRKNFVLKLSDVLKALCHDIRTVRYYFKNI